LAVIFAANALIFAVYEDIIAISALIFSVYALIFSVYEGIFGNYELISNVYDHMVEVYDLIFDDFDGKIAGNEGIGGVLEGEFGVPGHIIVDYWLKNVAYRLHSRHKQRKSKQRRGRGILRFYYHLR